MKKMNEKELYYSIQDEGIVRVEQIASHILKILQAQIGIVSFPPKLNSIQKIYILLENGYYSYLEKILIENNYSFEAEIQYLIKVLSYFDRKATPTEAANLIKSFPTIKSIDFSNNQYIINSMFGTINITPLHRFMKDSRIRHFSLSDDFSKFCHEGVRSFLVYYPEYKGVTSLIPSQFGEKQYHSYVELETGYADFSNNVYLSKKDFEGIMNPEVLSKVYGYEVDEKMKNLKSWGIKEEKSNLVRIAVDEQIKRRK